MLWGDGTGHFTSGPGFDTGTANVGAPAIGDFNGDGIPDFYVANWSDGTITFIYGAGNRQFQSPASTYAADIYPSLGGGIDLDDDGQLDVAIGNGGADYFTVLRNVAGLFPIAQAFKTGGADTRSIAIADFNNDGKPDVVTQNSATNTISVFLNASP